MTGVENHTFSRLLFSVVRIHLFRNLAMQSCYEYIYYNIEEYYDIGRSISVINMQMSLYFMKTLKMSFKISLLHRYQCLSSIL